MIQTLTQLLPQEVEERINTYVLLNFPTQTEIFLALPHINTSAAFHSNIISPVDSAWIDRRAHNFQAWYQQHQLSTNIKYYNNTTTIMSEVQSGEVRFIHRCADIIHIMFCMISYRTISYFHISCTGYRNQKV